MNKLFCFRNDLRLHDNQALLQAALAVQSEMNQANTSQLFAVYIATPTQWLKHDVAPIQLDFIERQLNRLGLQLAALGVSLTLLECEDFSQVPSLLLQFMQQHNIDQMFASKDIEFNEQQRDKAIIAAGIDLRLVSQDCIVEHGQVLNQAGQMYKVFTPFANAWRSQVVQQQIVCAPMPAALAQPIKFESITFNCSKQSSEHWPVGEMDARQQLITFMQLHIDNYSRDRDYPALASTSLLSPYLAVGILSPRQVLALLLIHSPQLLQNTHESASIWFNQLVWREFYRHLLVAFPKLSRSQNFNHKADAIVWRNNRQEFIAWTQGKTGYPIVDAAMQQLNQTGWMHNRLRMVCASFLTKHLLIDWRWGERYFRQKLIDGDLANNNGGWQWAAGTGCDAQPYFRIFNPTNQSKKFDPNAQFIRHYLPELTHQALAAIHQPLSSAKSQVNGNLLLANYPEPIVEHQFARQRALSCLAAIKAS
ncbi:deoxyribodipyrimidine photo-lyase [Shewanella marina]|uniref:deoxyribodipyrimidine photo-lyase n=1 Tax=Shewanella marina TaxID=487319 RepID=UPI0004721B78|nr:deoxyribodipyrimidine photo-lyase [Shewanella marina]